MDIGNLDSYFNNIYSNTEKASQSKLESALNGDYSKASDDELMDVCKQFESYFIEQMYKEMMKTIPENEEKSASINTMLDYYKDEMVKHVADDTSNQGNLGLAQMLYEQMKRNYGVDPSQIESMNIDKVEE